MSKFETIKQEIIDALTNVKYGGDMGDLGDIGNEIGIVIAKHFSDGGYQKEDFIHGLNHGISLTDGTHG